MSAADKPVEALISEWVHAREVDRVVSEPCQGAETPHQ